MNIGFEKPERPPTENLIGLINIIFLLLIFFMLAGTLSAPDAIKVEPPESVAKQLDSQDELRILLSASLEVAIDGNITTRAALPVELTRLLRDDPDARVRLVADATLEAGVVVALLKELGEAGLEKVTLATRQVQ